MSWTGHITLSRLARAGLWVLIYLFLLSYLHPELVLRESIVTGGDTASHYYTAVYLKEHLLPRARLVGWLPGNYAGFPLFQLYFPLAFLAMAVLSVVVPLSVAFKVISLAGVLTLPLAAFLALKAMGFERPAPHLGAAFVLPFLFMEANSAWGGNIPSTLAGEFAYGISLSLALVYLGRLFRDIKTGRSVVSNAGVLALVGLAHGYPLLLCVLGGGFFLLTTRDWIARLAYLLKVNLLAFLFLAFWLVPLLLFAPYGTAYNFVWPLEDWQKVLPPILWPFVGAGLAAAGISLLHRGESAAQKARLVFLLYLVLVSGLFYFLAYRLGVVDIRFIPFAQVFLVLLGAAGLGRLLGFLRTRSLAALALAVGTVVWTVHFETYLDQWVVWNYSGYQTKRLWPAFQGLTDSLKGTWADPRVAYEHAEETKAVGTIRAFESLPLFSGRATLEGLYIQSSLSAPFVFYLQSEISPRISSPLSQYNYSRFDLNRGQKHLALFNVGQYITVTEESRRAAQKTPGLELQDQFPPFALFKLRGNQDRYVVQPRFAPVLVVGGEPKAESFAWFRRGDLEVPLVWAERVPPEAKGRFAAILGRGEVQKRLGDLPRRPLPPGSDLEETIREEEIIVQGAVPGRPLWVRVSYHPNWHVQGAERVWRASPAFMLVFPTASRVRLYFGRTWPDYLGLVLTLLGLAYAVSRFRSRHLVNLGPERPDLTALLRRALAPLARIAAPRAGLVRGGALALLGGLAVFAVLAVHLSEPHVLYRLGLGYFQAGKFARAETVLAWAMDEFPLSPVVDQTLHHLALSRFKQKRFEAARKTWARFETEYPESRLQPEALYHIGLCHLKQDQLREATRVFQELRDRFPESFWAEEAGRRLTEAAAPGRLYQEAMRLFDQGRFEEARELFARVQARAAQEGLGEQAAYFVAVSLFKAGRWSEALEAFQDLLRDYPQGPARTEALFHLGLIRLHLGDPAGARREFKAVIEKYPDTDWGRRAGEYLARPELGGVR